MKIILENTLSALPGHKVSDIVTQIQLILQSAGLLRNCVIVNDIPEDICLLANKEIFTRILKNILFISISHNTHSCIRISAKVYHDILLIRFKVKDSLKGPTAVSHIHQLQLQANKIAGFLDITNIRNEVTTIAFTVLNVKNSGLAKCVQNQPPVTAA